jgi:hypothetical protein
VVLVAIMIALCVKKASDAHDNCYDDLVVKTSNTEHQIFKNNVMELEKKLKAIGQPPRKINKFYR